MSYDIHIAGHDFNYTWNLADFFYDLLPHGGIKGLDNLTGADAASDLSKAFIRLKNMQSQSGATHIEKKYNPENGWGDVFTATILLGTLLALCYENPDERISVC